jgi:acetyltransferase-like isoleucine patch superfamily enzyme
MKFQQSASAHLGPPLPVWAHPNSFVPAPIITERPAPSEIAFGNTDPSLPGFVEIGAHTYYVPSETRFLGYVPGEKIIIGKYCSIARDITILVGGNHTTETVSTYPFDTWFLGRMNPTRSYKTTPDTEIGCDVWIGHGAHIASGVRIGHGAVIASRAAVFTDVPPFGIAVGNPARVNRYRFSESAVEALLRIAWWDWPDEMVRRNVEWFYRPVGVFINQFDPAGGVPAGATYAGDKVVAP